MLYLHCCKCGKFKTTNEFYQYKGLDQTICRQCLNTKQRKNHRKNMKEHHMSCQCPDCQIDKINAIRDIKKMLRKELKT